MIIKLLSKGADIHCDNDWTLRFSAKHGNADMVKILLKHNAGVHAHDNRAFMISADYGHAKMIKILCQCAY